MKGTIEVSEGKPIVSLFCNCKRELRELTDELNAQREELRKTQRELRAAQTEFDTLHEQVTKRWRRALAVERNQERTHEAAPAPPAHPPAALTRGDRIAAAIARRRMLQNFEAAERIAQRAEEREERNGD